MGVEASLVVEFGDSEDSGDIVLVELDETHTNNLNVNDDGEEELKSTFEPGDTPVFMIHHADTVQIDAVRSTSGTLSQLSAVNSREREQEILMTTEKTKTSLSYSGVNTITESKFYGNECVLEIKDSKITTSGGTYPASALIKFGVSFQERWMLTPPSLTLEKDETYPITIVVYASKA